MATSHSYIDTGSTLALATNTVSEDAITKHIGRSILNDSAGTELATAAAPFKVNLVAIGSGTLAAVTTVGSVGVVGSISSVGAAVTVVGTINTVSTVASVANIASVGALVSVTGTINTVSTIGTVANIASVGALVSVASINTVNTLLTFAKAIKTKSIIYSSTNETDLVGSVSAKKIKVFAISAINASTAGNTIYFKDATTGNTVWSVPFVPQGVQGANLAVSVPSFLFASAGTSTPISIDFATATTAHISVSYWDDDAA